MAIEYIYHGHMNSELRSSQYTVLIDPFFTNNPQAKIGPEDVNPDFILVSHGHGDHVGDTLAIAERTGALVIANFEVANWLSSQGAKNVHAMHIGGAYEFPFGRVKLTIAHHGSALPDGSYGGNPAGFLITMEGKKIYYAGDTALTYDMIWLRDENVDLAVLPIGDNFTMGPEDAVEAIKLIKPKMVVPAHYNTWPVIAQDPNRFKAMVEAETDTKCMPLEAEGHLTL